MTGIFLQDRALVLYHYVYIPWTENYAIKWVAHLSSTSLHNGGRRIFGPNLIKRQKKTFRIFF